METIQIFHINRVLESEQAGVLPTSHNKNLKNHCLSLYTKSVRLHLENIGILQFENKIIVLSVALKTPENTIKTFTHF